MIDQIRCWEKIVGLQQLIQSIIDFHTLVEKGQEKNSSSVVSAWQTHKGQHKAKWTPINWAQEASGSFYDKIFNQRRRSGLQNFVPYHSNLWMNITPRSYSVPSLLQCESTIGGLLPKHRIPKNRRRRLPILKLGGQYVRNYLRQLLRDTPTILTNDERSRHFRGRGEFSKSISYGIIEQPRIMPQTNISPINRSCQRRRQLLCGLLPLQVVTTKIHHLWVVPAEDGHHRVLLSHLQTSIRRWLEVFAPLGLTTKPFWPLERPQHRRRWSARVERELPREKIIPWAWLRGVISSSR